MNATVSGPITGGVHGWPFGRPLTDLATHGYREDEYFLEGEATRYRLLGEMTRDGRWAAEPAGTAPYRTRLVVYRPQDPAAFNGTVLVHWNNVTAGYDLYTPDTPEMIEGGYAYVAVTTQRVGIEGLDPLWQGMRTWDPERYGSLFHPGDDYSFDIYTHAALLVGRDRVRPGLDLLGGLDVRHVIGLGASQSAGRVVTYTNAIHAMTHAFDAYLPTIWFGSGTPLEVGDAVINIHTPAARTGERRIFRGSHQIRDDLDVPVMVVNSELEATPCYDVRQPDTDRFRYWEAAGPSHVSRQVMRARAPKYERDFGRPLRYHENMNQMPMGPVNDAALRHLRRWVEDGTPPPTQPRIEFVEDPKAILRDEHGIARGGIRLPQAEVPVACNSAIPLGPDIYSLLWGSCEPFPIEKVRAMYGDRETYLARFEEAARSAEKAGVLLARDVENLVEEARENYPA